MSGSEPVPPSRDQLLQEAATWFARMRGPEADASREEFEAWLKRGALHRQAYNRASEIFAMGKVLAEDAEPTPRDKQPRAQARSRAGLAWAVGLLLLLVAAGWLAIDRFGAFGGQGDPIANGDDVLPPGQILETTSTGPRTVQLADGSIVELAPGSMIEVRLGAAERRLDLRRGQARFRVFHDVRPFIVHAGGGQIVARGTVFDVGLAANRRVTVRLVEGSIDVTYPAQANASGAAPSTRRLTPGQSLTFGAAREAAAEPPESSPPHAQIAAAQVRLEPQQARDFDNVTLGQIVAEANRTSPLPVRLSSPALAERRVSGRFRIDDTALLAERLAILFDLTTERQPDGILLRPR